MRKELEEAVINVGLVKDVHKFKYSGAGVSNNQYYKSSHWTQRNKLVNEYHEIILDFIGDKLDGKDLDKFGLLLFYNSRHDTDNIVGFGKIFVDVLNKELNVIKEDNKHHYKVCMTAPDLDLPHNTFEFLLIEYENETE